MKYIVLLSLLMIFGCAPKAVDVCGFNLDVYGKRVTWESKDPIVIYIDASFPEGLKAGVYRSVDNWEKILKKKMFQVVDGKINEAGKRNDRTNVISYIPYDSDKSSTLGITSLWWGNAKIYEADITINANNLYYLDNQKDGEYSIESLLTHELGHFLGLAHSGDYRSIMYPWQITTYKQYLTDKDIKNIRCGYP